MSFVAQTLLHPKVNQTLAVLATSLGREKVARLFQYLSRLLAWYFARRGSFVTADRFAGLKEGLAAGRKVIRLVKPIEFLQTAIKLTARPVTTSGRAGQVAHVTQIGRQVALAGYYTFEMLVWLGTNRALRVDKDRLTRLNRLAFKCWLTGISLSLISTGSSLVKLRADGRRFALANSVARREYQEKSPEDRVREEEERREKGRALLAQRQTLLSQLVMDSCDFWIPATTLGYTNLNEGVIGVLGALTSYMAIQIQWRKHASAARK
ncbi:peroxisomal biogenesis factor 11 [Papiliotrema laurentii]|uniref:Peroxisomal biogenesis factor 11 n=1 Tax=Papiliotrema laurentii TaxID=5418 RepID=A0AAD9D1B8_PAPLA|nr:peroxisomal biogenesis factor 11 [Papiliotrema laurentii]